MTCSSVKLSTYTFICIRGVWLGKIFRFFPLSHSSRSQTLLSLTVLALKPFSLSLSLTLSVLALKPFPLSHSSRSQTLLSLSRPGSASVTPAQYGSSSGVRAALQHAGHGGEPSCVPPHVVAAE